MKISTRADTPDPRNGPRLRIHHDTQGQAPPARPVEPPAPAPPEAPALALSFAAAPAVASAPAPSSTARTGHAVPAAGAPPAAATPNRAGEFRLHWVAATFIGADLAVTLAAQRWSGTRHGLPYVSGWMAGGLLLALLASSAAWNARGRRRAAATAAFCLVLTLVMAGEVLLARTSRAQRAGEAAAQIIESLQLKRKAADAAAKAFVDDGGTDLKGLAGDALPLSIGRRLNLLHQAVEAENTLIQTGDDAEAELNALLEARHFGDEERVQAVGQLRADIKWDVGRPVRLARLEVLASFRGLLEILHSRAYEGQWKLDAKTGAMAWADPQLAAQWKTHYDRFLKATGR